MNSQISEAKAFEIVGRQQVEIVVLRERVALLEANIAASREVSKEPAEPGSRPKRVK